MAHEPPPLCIITVKEYTTCRQRLKQQHMQNKQQGAEAAANRLAHAHKGVLAFHFCTTTKLSMLPGPHTCQPWQILLKEAICMSCIFA